MASIGSSWGTLVVPKTMIFLRCFNVFGIGPSSLQFRLTCPILRHHEPSWGHLGTLLGPLGAILGPSWASLGPPWALLGPPWCHHGAIVAHLGAIWGHLGTSLVPSGAMLEPSWANLVPFGALLAPSGHLPGPCWVYFGAILGVSFAIPFLSLCPSGALLYFLNLTFYLSFSCLSTQKKR